jgi:hypothetical protein
MNIAFLTEGKEGFSGLFGGIAKVLCDRGDAVMACYMGQERPHDLRVKHNPCSWTYLDFGQLEKFSPDRVVVFNGRDIGNLAATTYLQHRFHGRVVHAELGWLPQAGNIYLDWKGCGGWSNLRLERNLPEANQNALKKLRDEYKPKPLPDGFPRDFILVPLQLDLDTSITYDSPYVRSMFSLGGFVVRHFADQHVVIRRHPRGDLGLVFPGAIYVEDSISTKDLAFHAKALVGINSTSLIEALVHYKPVLTLGHNVASGKGVFYEGSSAFSNPRKILKWSPDADRVDRVLSLLLSKQFLSSNPPPNIFDTFFNEG